METNLHDFDNELLTQYMLDQLNQIICEGGGIDAAIQKIQTAFFVLRYKVMTQVVTREDLKKIIYYARLTRRGMFLSPYHPIRLVGTEGLSASYHLLYSDQNYLPNIVSVLDYNDASDTVTLISMQRFNFIHRRPSTEEDVNVIEN